VKGEDEAMNYSVAEIDPSSFGSSSTVVMLNLWRGPSRPSIKVALSRIMNCCSEESLARLSILVMSSYL
jgi:hypothetical protein